MSRPVGSQGKCSACGMYGHIARGGECSKAQKARRAVSSGMSQAAAARELGISAQNVSDAVLRRYRSTDSGPIKSAPQIEEHW